MLIPVLALFACSTAEPVSTTTVPASSSTSMTEPAPVPPTTREPETAEAQRGTIEELLLDSTALGQQQAVSVYLPPGYTDAMRLPVLYLLHGQQENNRMWLNLGLAETADRLIDDGLMPPMLIVMPDIDNSFGVNNPESVLFDIPDGPSVFYDGNAYEDFLANELPEVIDNRYATIGNSSGRYVGGISMGGFAAIRLGLLYPDTFTRVGGHSPALVTDREFTWLYPPEVPLETRDPFLMAPVADLSTLEIWLDVGSDDQWGFRPPTEAFAALLAELGADVQLTVGSGDHSFTYWRPNLEDYLLFYANGFIDV